MLLAAAGASLLAAVLWLPRAVLWGGLALALAAALHLAAAQAPMRRWIPKECSVAVIYATGIWLAPLLLATRRSAWTGLVAGLHFLGVLLNLGMYAVIEEAVDSSEDSASIARVLGARTVRRGVFLLTAAGAAAVAIGIRLAPRAYAAGWAPLLLLLATPAVLLAFPSLFVPRFRYRVVGELVFLALAAPLLFGR